MPSTILSSEVEYFIKVIVDVNKQVQLNQVDAGIYDGIKQLLM